MRVGKIAFARHAQALWPIADVVEYVQPGKQRAFLKHHAAVRSGTGDTRTIEQNFA